MHPDTESPLSVTRRKFFQFLQCLGFGAWLGPVGPQGPESSWKRRALPGRVIHVQDAAATSWDFTSGWYGYSVDQVVVNEMVEKGLLELTGEDTVSGAWGKLIPTYVTGEKIAIKVNFNNYYNGGADPDPDINALIEPVNALIGTLLAFGVWTQDIVVYDVTHGFHDGGIPKISFTDRCLYPGVEFVGYTGNPDPFSATEKVQFSPPPPNPPIPDLAVCNALADSAYLINMPIVKAHPYAYVALSFKNHLGSIDRCDEVHKYLPIGLHYDPDYCPLLDLWKNPHFRAKTVLTVGDALFGNWNSVSGSPKKWITFGDEAPNSLFFSADPVALDSVMADYIDLERQAQGLGTLHPKARDYLKLAARTGLGIHEKGDPWRLPRGSGYRRIFYCYFNEI
jgi:hypothetical protein